MYKIINYILKSKKYKVELYATILGRYRGYAIQEEQQQASGTNQEDLQQQPGHTDALLVKQYMEVNEAEFSAWSAAQPLILQLHVTLAQTLLREWLEMSPPTEARQLVTYQAGRWGDTATEGVSEARRTVSLFINLLPAMQSPHATTPGKTLSVSKDNMPQLPDHKLTTLLKCVQNW